ncbi:MAG: DUF4041 domain-containing protein [Peptostreptococcus porci]|nr:DUF4041 domain-containing protein [Peptostreptococcus porci]
MGLFGKSKKQLNYELEKLNKELIETREKITPEMYDALAMKEKIKELREEMELKEDKVKEKTSELEDLEKEIHAKKNVLDELNLELDFTEYGIYKPVYDFANSEMYKDRLLVIRQKQKDAIKNDDAVTYPENFYYNDSLSKGKKVIKDSVKQILRSFNNECDVLINKVKYNNVEAIRGKIGKSYESLNKLNDTVHITIRHSYLQMKLEELNLAYEYSLKKQEEKELAKEERERLREEARLQKEIDEARKSIKKEQAHYSQALSKIEKQLEVDSTNIDLLAKKEELENQLCEIDKNLKDIDYREANKRAGYVYIISNIGSFGKDIYKIGMTRRLEPMDRVHELGDASVPFNFDLHALIFSDDAPSLENALHKAFENNKVNMVNSRREFFNVKLEEIEAVVKANFDKVVEFNRIPDAQQYYETIAIKKEYNNNLNNTQV